MEKVISLWCLLRLMGSSCRYSRVSCIQPMFHFMPKPMPPAEVGAVMPGHAVDSSAITMTPGLFLYAVAVASLRKSMASRFSRPP